MNNRTHHLIASFDVRSFNSSDVTLKLREYAGIVELAVDVRRLAEDFELTPRSDLQRDISCGEVKPAPKGDRSWDMLGADEPSEVILRIDDLRPE